MTVAHVASKIARINGVAPNRGATSDEVLATEFRLGTAIPSEIKELVAVMDGCNGETPPEQSWTRFWPMQEWRMVADLGSTTDFAEAIVFADYCQESWWYAFEAAGAGPVRVAKINGPDCIVSESLLEFLEGVLHDDPKIYGPHAG